MLINPLTLEISFDDVMQLFATLSIDEESRICKYITKKQMFSRNLSGVETNIGENNWPLSHIEESILLNHKRLVTTWKEKYITHFFNGFNYTQNDINKICKEYLYGIQWIWAYYTGNITNVCFNWCYPFSLPPLWQWITDYLKTSNSLPKFPDTVYIKADDIRPVEQLAIVLPLESWNLIPSGPERNLPLLAPQFYPDSFTFDSVGKRFFWECESMIPLPSILEVKQILGFTLSS
jgi:5'-3' exonuclease